jgi:hypothetical protein
VPDRTVKPDLTGQVRVRPQAVLATDTSRLEVERTARQAALEREQTVVGVGLGGFAAASLRSATLLRDPIPVDARLAALKAVDADLTKAGMIDAQGNPAEKLVAELSWERVEWLPTAGLLVKGCLDRCDTCEPALKRQIELELERQALENKLLERQIELLDKAHEYRCCPSGEAEDVEG